MYTMTELKRTRVLRIAGAWLATALLVGGMGPVAAYAQGTDGRWLAWIGCWQPVGEAASADAPDAMLCFQPLASDIGVEMISVEDGEIVGRETVRATGQPRDASLQGCTGWERGDFSARPGRVFLSSEYVCDGGVARTSTGMLAMLSSGEWVDVMVVTAGGESSTWVTTYRLATQGDAEAAGLGDVTAGLDMAIRSAGVAASARPSVDDVIEAARYVDAEGVQAWLEERDVPLDLDSEKLVRMADAGVPEEVIDMVVALSYPERFAVEGEPERYGRTYQSFGRAGYYTPFYGSLFYAPYGYRYGRGYGFGYGYGYGYGGRYHGPTVIRVDRGDTGGRVIKGQGYRRGQKAGASRSSAPSARGSSRGTSTGRTAKRRSGGS